MASDPPPDLLLTPLHGEARTLQDHLTFFHLVVVVVDPFTNESAWILETAGRLLATFGGADCRVGWVVTGTAAEAKAFLGPWAEELMTFADPDRDLVKGIGLERLPALVHLNLDCKLVGEAEGWNPATWRPIFAKLSRLMSWSRPTMPLPGDPSPYEGSPALG